MGRLNSSRDKKKKLKRKKDKRTSTPQVKEKNTNKKEKEKIVRVTFLPCGVKKTRVQPVRKVEINFSSSKSDLLHCCRLHFPLRLEDSSIQKLPTLLRQEDTQDDLPHFHAASPTYRPYHAALLQRSNPSHPSFFHSHLGDIGNIYTHTRTHLIFFDLLDLLVSLCLRQAGFGRWRRSSFRRRAFQRHCLDSVGVNRQCSSVLLLLVNAAVTC